MVVNMKALIPFIVALLLIGVLATFQLHLPVDVQAGPLPGFTPDPGDDGDDDDGNDVSPPPPDDDSGTTPTDYVLVRVDQCDLACSGQSQNASAEQSQFEPLAYHIDDAPIAPILLPLAASAVDFEIIVPVRMVHEGSGFIAVGDLSTQRSTHISVPYAGEWEVFLTDAPRFMTAEAVEITGTNLAQLEQALSDGPVSMGVVEANTAETQLIKCPIECVIETPPPASDESPTVLPQTGGNRVDTLVVWLLVGVTLATLGLTAYLSSKKASVEKTE